MEVADLGLGLTCLWFEVFGGFTFFYLESSEPASERYFSCSRAAPGCVAVMTKEGLESFALF